MRLLLPLAALAGAAFAETGLKAWLRFAPFPGAQSHLSSLPQTVVALNATTVSPVHVAGKEIRLGLEGIFNHTVKVDHPPSKTYANSSALVVGTVAEYEKAYGALASPPDLIEDGYWLDTTGSVIKILGENERGALYGAFQYLSMVAQGNFTPVAYASNPVAPIRWINQWDNLDGSITRGYGGLSIFFSNGTVRENLDRVVDYARLMASLGLNGIIINNVNADSNLFNSTNIAGMKRVADAMRPYGVQIGASINFAAPELLGNLTTFDPLDPGVITWWDGIFNRTYAAVPDFAGVLIKANSEGQPGPLTYNRTLAQGANLFADALAPHGGIVMFRAFVYNLLNYTDWTEDRANAAQDLVGIYDGQYRDNVVIQAKFGPIDFQVREPAQPIFAHLTQTNSAMELEVAQEYLGQQDHVVYLPPLWQTIFQFDMRVNNQTSYVRDIYTGKTFNRPLGGSAAVVNVGLNQTWLGSQMSMSNLYAYGRLAWDPTQDSEALLDDWTRLTFSMDPTVVSVINQISMTSWPAYENYSGNLGMQTLTDILYTHYGPNPISQEYNGYGQWFRISQTSIGMDRTCWNGTGPGTCNAGQYPPQVYEMFENIETTPENLLLWFHHVPFTYQLSTGETVIQHFYNAHYAGAETANTYPGLWSQLEGKIDNERYNDQLYEINYQAGHSIVWRDIVSEFFYNWSSIPDELNRVGNHPYRLQAETMTLDGYRVSGVAVPPYQKNQSAIVTVSNSTQGTATASVQYPSGTYDIVVSYYDLYPGISTWELHLNNKKIGQWKGNHENTLGHELTYFLDGNSESRISFPGVNVTKGDTVKIVGTPDGGEPAPVNYIAFLPAGVLD